jgi:signal transduction histidine kinase
LTSIAGSLALLLRGAGEPLSKPATRLITIAHDNSQRLVRLINDVLDLEKMESGSVVFTLQPVDLKSFLEQVADANRPYADSRAVTIRIDSAAMLDSIDTDPDWLAQVVTNLLSNAIRFSPPGGDVAISAGLHDNCARISVRDHGPGVPPDFRSRLFERFARADSSANQKGSSGLGLSIVQEIVARLGGQASFDEAPGGGAIFHVDLPLRDRRPPNAMPSFEDAAE